MREYNSILNYIDDINGSVVTTESNVLSSLINSYYRQYELFTECQSLGKNPYDIYQEASIMDEVKEQSKNDKNKLITFFKFVPRLVITIIKKIKEKLFGKKNVKTTNTTNNSSAGSSDGEKPGIEQRKSGKPIPLNKETIGKMFKAISKSKAGKIALGGGITVTALATGGLLVSKAVGKNKGKSKKKKNGKSKDVKIKVTKDNKMRCNFNIKKIKKYVERISLLFKKNIKTINDKKKLDPKDVEQFEETVNDLEKELETPSAEVDTDVDISDLTVDEVTVDALQDAEADEVLKTLSKESDNSSSDEYKEIDQLEQSTEQFIKTTPKAIEKVNESVDTIIEASELVDSLETFNPEGGWIQGESDNNKEDKISNNSANETMIKDNVEKLTKFLNNALENLKDIEDSLPTHAKYLKKDISDSIKLIEQYGDRYDNNHCRNIILRMHSSIIKILMDPIVSIYCNDFVDAPDDNLVIPKGKVPEVLKYLRHIGYEDVKFDVGDRIHDNDRGLFDVSNTIDTDDETKKGTIAKIYIKPLQLNLDNFDLSHVKIKKKKVHGEQTVEIVTKDDDFNMTLGGVCDVYKKSSSKSVGGKKVNTAGHGGGEISESEEQARKDRIRNYGEYIPRHIIDDYVSHKLSDKSEKRIESFVKNIDFVTFMKDVVERRLSVVLSEQNYDELLKVINKAIEDVKSSIDKDLSIERDIVSPLHSAIYKYVYKLFDEQVDYRERLRPVLHSMMYKGVSTYGKDFKSVAKYFENAVPESTDDPNKKGKISKVNRTPFKLSNEACVNIDGSPLKNEYILKGACSYYKS